jgi:hypothetical protein
MVIVHSMTILGCSTAEKRKPRTGGRGFLGSLGGTVMGRDSHHAGAIYAAHNEVKDYCAMHNDPRGHL